MSIIAAGQHHPTIAVVIPCYNQAHYLAASVGSVLAQTCPHWDLVIVDDGSRDDTAEVAAALIAANPDRSIRLLRQPNQGLSASRNNGIRAARGEYVLPLDADDALAPEMLARTAAVLNERADVGFVYTDVHMFGEETTIWSGGAYSLERLRFDCPMMPATLFRRSAWAAAGGFMPTTPQGYEDWNFWLTLAEAGWQGWHIAEPLLHYRRASGGMLANARRHDLALRAQLILNHPRLYEPGFVAWAQMVCSPAWSERGTFRSAGHWLIAFAVYVRLIARYQPQLVPKTLARPAFCCLPVRQQARARRLARALRLSRGRRAPPGNDAGAPGSQESIPVRYSNWPGD